jgi:hypothetical protein
MLTVGNRALRPVFNFTPRGSIWSTGVQLAPRKEVGPWGTTSLLGWLVPREKTASRQIAENLFVVFALPSVSRKCPILTRLKVRSWRFFVQNRQIKNRQITKSANKKSANKKIGK